MPRFYCPTLSQWIPQSSAGAIATNSATFPLRLALDDGEARHARQVLRLRPGDPVELMDGRGLLAQGTIEPSDPADRHSVWVQVNSAKYFPPLIPALDIAAAVPKGSAADEMLDQLSQLGATRFIPLRTQRSVVDPRPAKLDRLARNVIESAKQCGRAHLMEIEPTMTLEQVLTPRADAAGNSGDASRELRLIAHPGVASSEILSRVRAAARVLVLIGPEGGFTDEEVARAQSQGCLPWSLGPHILRIETAAAAATAILRASVLH